MPDRDVFLHEIGDALWTACLAADAAFGKLASDTPAQTRQGIFMESVHLLAVYVADGNEELSQGERNNIDTSFGAPRAVRTYGCSATSRELLMK